MRKPWIHFALFLLLLSLLATPALAEDGETELTGYLAGAKADFEGASEKIVSLAEAIPADKYGWAPAEGVRTVSEALIHVAGANFFFAQMGAGVPMPENYSRDAEKTVTAKDDVVAMLKQSLEHGAKVYEANAGADLDEEIDMFGDKRPKRTILFILNGHAHEHLGQLIAYARSIGVAPPWSQGGGEG